MQSIQLKLQQKMLQGKQLDKLYEILNSKEQLLQEIEGQFLVVFNENFSVFKASFTLSNLINSNVLTLQQRIIALFLLIQNYKSQGIKKHPFGGTIFSTSETTNEAFERRMIADLIVDGKRQKYSKVKLEELVDEEQTMLDIIEERPQIKKLRDQFISLLPKISQTRRSQLLNTDLHYSQANKNKAPEEFNRGNVKDQQDIKGNLGIGFMRPIPKFIQINPFQLNWLSPGIIADVHWDNSVDVQKKLTKCKGYIKKGLQSKLSKQQSTEIDRCLENEAYAVLNLDVTPQNLILLINNNPFVAVSFLVKLGNYPIIGDYLQSILDCNISLNCIDVVVRLIKASRVPEEFIEAFALKNLKQSQGIGQNNKQRGKMARIISNFIKVLARNKIIDLNPFTQDINAFSNHFRDIQEVQFLTKLISQKQNLNQDE